MCFIRSFVPISRCHFIFFPFTEQKNQDIPGTVGVSNPVSRNFKTQFSNIPSQKVANPASRKGPAGPLALLIMICISFPHLKDVYFKVLNLKCLFISACRTVNNKKCAFPFKHKDKIHHKCTSDEDYTKLWCSYKNQADGQYEKWGDCKPYCSEGQLYTVDPLSYLYLHDFINILTFQM